ncbi:unnamed protein product [Allacma fusca]|uniref:Uncharacterized protein n=1 Tax=Allacma fusca TaxID=39272 RepID=A0A8J2KD65_9HEXA|nr:unnamed protein product [Allacma fusca]
MRQEKGEEHELLRVAELVSCEKNENPIRSDNDEAKFKKVGAIFSDVVFFLDLHEEVTTIVNADTKYSAAKKSFEVLTNIHSEQSEI